MKIEIESLDGVVVSLSEARRRRAGLRVLPGEECMHRQITLDPMTKDADCNNCKKTINLGSWMIEQMHIWDHLARDTAKYLEAKKALDEEREAYSRQQRVKCQHCNKFTRKTFEREATKHVVHFGAAKP